MKTPLIIKLDFEDDDLFAGTEAIALVEQPAIETDFFTFKKEKFASYSDYPKAVSAAAQRGIKLNEKVNNKCATRVGKIRATQLADGKPITEETIKRMYAYLSRAKEYYNPNDTEACGTISYLLWGGEPALGWSERKLAQLEREREMRAENEIVDSDMNAEQFKKLLNDMALLPASEKDNVIAFFNALGGGGCGCKNVEDNAKESFCDIDGDCGEAVDYKTSFSVVDKDEQMIVSPVMIPNKPILRKDEDGELFYVYFSEDTVKRMAHKFLIEKRIDRFNIEHDSSTSLGGISLVESWVKAGKGDKSSNYGYKNLPNGTWFVQLKVNDTNLWKMIKDGIVKGLSLEGTFSQKIQNNKEKFVEVTTEGGTKLFVKEESLVTFIVDKDGNLATVAPDGEYKLDDGTLLRVVDGKADKFPA